MAIMMPLKSMSSLRSLLHLTKLRQRNTAMTMLMSLIDSKMIWKSQMGAKALIMRQKVVSCLRSNWEAAYKIEMPINIWPI